MKLEPGTTALITGASRGIGRATATALSARGVTLGLVARSSEELEQLAQELSGPNQASFALPADVGDEHQMQEAVERYVKEAGKIDVLIANAGVAWYGPVREMPVAEAERMTRINWLGTINTVSASLPRMLDRAEGNIVIVSSAAGFRSFPWAAVYGATKHAQRAYLEALRHELSGSGVTVTGVYPGEVKTHLHDDDQEHGRMPDWYRADTAIEPAEVAARIVKAIEDDETSVFVPPVTRLLGIVHGLSPRLANAMLRRIMGRTAAPYDG